MSKPDTALIKNVVFLFVETSHGLQPLGTGFFLGVKVEDAYFIHLVTAQHVVEEASERGHRQLLVRVNMKAGGSAHMSVPTDQWWLHPENAERYCDVAIIPVPVNLDTMDIVFGGMSVVLDNDLIAQEGIGAGDEVIVVGLFAHHPGVDQNVPIVRRGQLAAFPPVQVQTDKGRDIQVYLVELLSIGGLSGSPVWYLPPQLRVQDDGTSQTRKKQSGLLLGLVHGHFATQGGGPTDAEPGSRKERLNTGIALVVPAQRIVETLMQPRLVGEREAALKQKKQSAQ